MNPSVPLGTFDCRCFCIAPSSRRSRNTGLPDRRCVASTSSRHDILVEAGASVSRRTLLPLSVSIAVLSAPIGGALAAEALPSIEVLATAALKAYSDNDLPRARDYFNKIVERDSTNPVWLERRGQVLVDMKLFEEAITDFNAADAMYGEQSNGTYASLGLLSNRALAYEGLYKWKEAIDDYNQVGQFSSMQFPTSKRHLVIGPVGKTAMTELYAA